MKTALLLATIYISCSPPEPEHSATIPIECSSHDDCECDEVCGDTRTCSPTCSDDDECIGAVAGPTCGELQGYCVVECSDDDECMQGQNCSPDGVCWFEP